MSNARGAFPQDHPLPEAFYVLPGPQSLAASFCALVTRALRCRRCAVALYGPDGEPVHDDVVELPWDLADRASGIKPRLSRPTPIEAGKPLATPDRQGRGSLPAATGEAALPPRISFPLALTGGATGVIQAEERVDGAAFGPGDVELLGHLAAFYATALDTGARREVMRLRNELRSSRRQAIRTEERERQRLARELHDDVGHALTTAILSLDMQAQGVGDDVAAHALAEARSVLIECADHLHEVAFRLRPRVLNDLGLMPALRSLARRVRETGAVTAVVRANGLERRFAGDTELAAFRIVQEALTNALKHAHASQVIVDVTFSETGVEVEISDDGIGFVPDAANRRGQGGHGLAGMQERAELAGGVLEVQSGTGRGTMIWARLPVGEEMHG